jgi:hypothetical protein
VAGQGWSFKLITEIEGNPRNKFMFKHQADRKADLFDSQVQEHKSCWQCSRCVPASTLQGGCIYGSGYIQVAWSLK